MRRRRLCAFVLCLFCCVLSFGQTDLRAYRGNLFVATFFADPIEKMVIIFPNGEFFLFTSMQDNLIDMTPRTCVAILERAGRDIKDAIMVVHNHPMGVARFSLGDLGFLRGIRRYGFKGSYLVYHQPTKTVIIYEDK